MSVPTFADRRKAAVDAKASLLITMPRHRFESRCEGASPNLATLPLGFIGRTGKGSSGEEIDSRGIIPSIGRKIRARRIEELPVRRAGNRRRESPDGLPNDLKCH